MTPSSLYKGQCNPLPLPLWRSENPDLRTNGVLSNAAFITPDNALKVLHCPNSAFHSPLQPFAGMCFGEWGRFITSKLRMLCLCRKRPRVERVTLGKKSFRTSSRVHRQPGLYCT